MIQDRLNDKEHDIRGVQKQSSELLSIAWQKGYQAGFDDGYATRREADQRPQGECKCVTCKYRSCEITEKPCKECSRSWTDLYEEADMKGGAE